MNTPPPLQMTVTEWFTLAFLSMIWGGSFFFMGVAVHDVPPLTIVWLRVCLAAVALNLYVHMRGMTMPSLGEWRTWRVMAGMAVFNNILPFSLITWAVGHMESGVASILNATTPLFAVLVAHFFTTHEKMTRLRVAGIVLGMIGVAVLMGGGSLALEPLKVMAELACLLASCAYAFSGLFVKPLKAAQLPSIVLATGQVTTATVILLPILLMVERPWTMAMPAVTSLAAVASLALLSTAFAYSLYFRILTRAGATNASLVTFLVPVSAILLGTVLLGEHLLPKHFAGMAIIALGLLAIDGRPWYWLMARRG